MRKESIVSIFFQKRTRLLACSLLVLLPLTISAQRVLTLDSCRRLAITNNKQLSVARSQKEMASYNVKSAKTKYLPHVDAMAGYELMSKEVSILNNSQKDALNHLGTNAVTGVGARVTDIITTMVQDGTITPQMAQRLGQQMGVLSSSLATMGDDLGSTIRQAFRTNTRNMFAGAVMLTQPLYMGGSIKALNRVAELKANMADDNYDMLQQKVLYEIDATYWLVVSLRQKQKLAESFLDLVTKLHDDVYKMINEGVAVRADGLNVDVRVNEAEMAKMRVDDNLALVKMLLCQLCGLPMDTEFTLSDEGKELISATGQMPTEGTSTIDRPELRLLQTTIDISEQAQRVVTATHFRPQVALTGGYLISNPNTFNGFERKFSGVWNVGVMVRMPLWDWHDGRYKLAATRAATTIAKLERSDLEEKINLQVEQERFKVREAYRRLELSAKHVSSAEENLRCASLGFREGVMNLSDVMAAQTAWESAHTQKIDAEIEVQLSLIGLRKALGQL
ncbi:MAG: TolC family protein [Prevotella sp.]|nr:TolC family protein [Prevotella sp.]